MNECYEDKARKRHESSQTLPRETSQLTHTCNPGRVIYFELCSEKRHQVEITVKKRKKNWITEGRNRQLAASFGSGGCQYTGEMIEIGSGLKTKELLCVLRDWA